MAPTDPYKYLEPRPGTPFQQLFVKGKKYSAETLYAETLGEDARTPEEVARDWRVPLEAVLEAIDYCEKNQELLRRELEEEHARLRECENRHPPLRPPWSTQEA